MNYKDFLLALALGIAFDKTFEPEFDHFFGTSSCPVSWCGDNSGQFRPDDKRDSETRMLRAFSTVTAVITGGHVELILPEPMFDYSALPAWPPPARGIRNRLRVALRNNARVAMAAAIEKRLRFEPQRFDGDWTRKASIG